MKPLYLTPVAAIIIYLGTILQFPLPGTDIPQTGQTIAVLFAGAVLGRLYGPMAVGLYLLAGAVGLPVYSDSGSGLENLFGDSAGYFFGFLTGAMLMGHLSAIGLTSKGLPCFLSLLLGHAVILFFGFAWLARSNGIITAYNTGVEPFYIGSLAKSLITTFLIMGFNGLTRDSKSLSRLN
ncbi:MAG: biotin transporter BioY [Gammaproteobacteria bacterium]|nr:biotin transporter BioY [Gammaproteobacteria bacterium]